MHLSQAGKRQMLWLPPLQTCSLLSKAARSSYLRRSPAAQSRKLQRSLSAMQHRPLQLPPHMHGTHNSPRLHPLPLQQPLPQEQQQCKQRQMWMCCCMNCCKRSQSMMGQYRETWSRRLMRGTCSVA